jgi:hypothetical protein
LLACDACSGCSLALKNYLVKLEQNGQLGKLKGTTFIYGQSAYIPEGMEGKIVRIGTCTRNLSGCDSTYIPGCPPHPHNIDEEI